MWPFKKKPESPEEEEALKKLDEATREVSMEEFNKEADRELSAPGLLTARPLGWRYGRFRRFRYVKGDPLPEPVDDEDPAGGPSMHDVMQGADVDDAPKS